MVLYALLTAGALAIVAFTIAVTAREYGRLPDRVPLHFGFDGRAGSYGPRAAIWLIVAIQALILTASGLAEYPLLRDELPRKAFESAVVRLCILAFTAQLQFGLIAAAKSADPRLPMPQFWTSIAALIVAAIVTVRLF